MKKKIAFWSAIVVMFLVGIALLNVKGIERWMVSGYQPKVTAKSVAKAEKSSGNFDYDSAKQPSWSEIIKARQNEAKIHIVGVMAMPSVNVYLPIGKGVDNTVLALAAGTMRADQVMGQGNYALAGHNMDDGKTLFSPLYSNAKVDQKVYLTNYERVYVYKLTSRQVISPTQTSVVNNTEDPIITLITCNASGSMRICLQGKLTKTYSYKHAPKSIKTALNHDYNR